MIDGPYFVLITTGVLAAGLVARVCCAFSTFAMRALGSLPPAQAVAAMNAINRAATTPALMIFYLGAAVLCAVLAVVTVVLWPDDGKAPLLVGSALYLIGVFGVTAMANVPRNDILLRMDPGSSPEAPAVAGPESRARTGPWRRIVARDDPVWTQGARRWPIPRVL